MTMSKELSLEVVRNSLAYDSETGIFTWLVSNSNRVKIGDRAGVIATNGRRYINISGQKVMAHRLAWFYVTGEWPTGDVKQLDNDFDNCAWANLEHVSRSVASRNRALTNNNKSGFRGVSATKSGKWTAFITREYKQLNLGVFETPEEASAAYEQAAIELESAMTPEQKSIEAEKAANRRRLRVAWAKLKEVESEHFFADYNEFVEHVKEIPARHSVVSLDDFGPVGPGNWQAVPDLSTGFDLSTREGRIAYNRAHRKENPDLYKDRQLRKDFGISLSEYNDRLANQNGVCAICSRPERVERDGEVIGLSLDHDHSKDKKDRSGHRDLLCSHCNHAIGKFEDNPEYLQAAIAYLQKHSARPFVCDNPDRDWLLVATPGHPMN